MQEKETPFIITGSHQPEKRQLAYRMRREMTASEAVLWQRLQAGRLEGLHFRRQQVIADFYCHSARLVIEVDGPVHDHQGDYDAERDRILHAHGLRMLRFSNADISNDIETVLAGIHAAARPQSWKDLTAPTNLSPSKPLPSEGRVDRLAGTG